MSTRPAIRLARAATLLLLATTAVLSAGPISPLAPKPDWSALQAYQKTISRGEFARLINTVYSQDGGFWGYADINDQRVIVYSDLGHHEPLFTLNFAGSETSVLPRPYHYNTASVSSVPGKPLKGIKIALDPGHIGGDWAKLEARYFKLGDDPSVEEAKLNMITCERLAELLESDGAEIVWAKHSYEPVTHLRPDDLHHEAMAALAGHGAFTPSSSGYTPSFLFGVPTSHAARHSTLSSAESRVDNEAALLFYRVAEIRARGDVVNRQHPDLTICVHYNADDWGDDPDHHPRLVERSRLIIFVNGNFEKSELVYDDYKYDLLRKLLDRSGAQEERGCALVGQSMLNSFGYAPDYMPPSLARRVTDVPSVYTRDLIANRIYHGPVIYCEGPYMNAKDAYYRIIAGDYLGTKTIQGQSYPSIYRQYAASVEKGILQYFGK